MGMWDELDDDVARRVGSENARRIEAVSGMEQRRLLFAQHVSPLLTETRDELIARGTPTEQVSGVTGWPLLPTGRGYAPAFFLSVEGDLHVAIDGNSRGGRRRVQNLVGKVNETLYFGPTPAGSKDWSFTADGAVLHWTVPDEDPVAHDFGSYLRSQVVNLLVELEKAERVSPASATPSPALEASEPPTHPVRRRRWFGR
ncbi:hypothetical protein [Microbacterium dauci]|uniref:Uncharacterized protein n=1 Tax=Microbacterium dauci TaxID=3048008 RepID=A0ABT6ZAR5_9MICO|nr:hypothetical protein [Microbacterium sp. LX3-4]MDJ1113260.1 hypothetical protein [Microbacterium sp. LX3-4]